MTEFALALAILVILMVVSVPVPFAFAAAFLFLGSVAGMDLPMMLSGSYFTLASLTLLACPLFICAGLFMGEAGLADRLIRIANAFMGGFKSSLGAATVVACALTGAIAGTCSASAAAVGSVMIPQMEKEGYPRGYSASLVACSAILGQLIPPSVAMILYGFIARVSVTACFLSTIGPAILLIIIYCIINMFLARNMPIVKPSRGVGLRGQVKEIGSSFRYGFFTLLVPLIIFGGIYGGIMTPSESAAVALVAILIIGLFVYRTLTVKSTVQTFATASITTGVVMLMMFFAIPLVRVEIFLEIPQSIIALLTGISGNVYVILLTVNVFLFALGMIVGDFTATILITPMLLPLMLHIGVHPIHFAAILGTNLGLGNVTPPFAPILYLTARIGNVTVDKMLKPLVFFIIGTLPVVLATTYWPALALAIPKLVMPKLFL